MVALAANRLARRSVFSYCFALLTAVMFLPSMIGAQAPVSSEKLVPAISYKISKFVHWPETTRPKADAGNFYIGVASSDAVYKSFLAELDGKPIRGKIVRVIHLEGALSPDDLRRFQLIFTDSATVLKEIGGGRIRGDMLIISTVSGSASSGDAGVEIVANEKSLAFEVALKQLKAARLRAESSVLSLARKVHR